MNIKHRYANRLIFLIKVSVCLFLFLVSISSVSICQENERSQNLRRQVRDIYASQIGVREQGVNSGPQVQQYLSYVNLPNGNPWCAAFVCWVYGQAKVLNPKTGWSPDLFKSSRIIWERAESGKVKAESKKYKAESGKVKAESKKYKAESGKVKAESGEISQKLGNRYQSKIFLGSMLLLPTMNKLIVIGCQPGTGDVFGIYFPDKKRIAHVGFVDQWDGTWLITVEGNTNVSGSREGDGVYRKRRPVQSIYQVARYIAQP